MKTMGYVMLVLTLLPGMGFARGEEAQWENLKGLKVGQRIEVIDMKLRSLKGTFVSVSEEAISLQVGNNNVSVERPNVFRVSDRENSRRGRNALIGLAIGAGAVAPFAIIGGVICSNEGGNCADVIVPALAAGAGAGAGLGAAVTSYRTIYRAKKLKRAATVP